jgi:hypothetical protein
MVPGEEPSLSATAPTSICAPAVDRPPPAPIAPSTTLWRRQIDAEGAPFG